MPRILFIFLLLSLSIITIPHLAQGIKISGRIIDEETNESLPNAHVFLDQTTIGVVSNYSGEYTMDGVEHDTSNDYL